MDLFATRDLSFLLKLNKELVIQKYDGQNKQYII